MAQNFFRFFTENNPARGPKKNNNNIPDVNWLNKIKFTGNTMHNNLSVKEVMWFWKEQVE